MKWFDGGEESQPERGELGGGTEAFSMTVTDAELLRDLVTNPLRARARTRMRNDTTRTVGFAMADIENSNPTADTVYDGTTDRYMTARVQQVEDDQWRMSVNFRTTINKERMATASVWERYRFDWMNDGGLSAWKVTELHGYHGGEKRIEVIESHPINLGHCAMLRARMHEIADLVNPPEPGSIYSAF